MEQEAHYVVDDREGKGPRNPLFVTGRPIFQVVGDRNSNVTRRLLVGIGNRKEEYKKKWEVVVPFLIIKNGTSIPGDDPPLSALNPAGFHRQSEKQEPRDVAPDFVRQKIWLSIVVVLK